MEPAELHAKGLGVKDATILGNTERLHPIAWIDTSSRPDVADLVRLHRTEGEGDHTFRWIYYDEHLVPSTFILHIVLHRPLQAEFSLVFPMPEWMDIVLGIGEAHELTLVPGPPPNWNTWKQQPGQDLRSLLNAFVHREIENRTFSLLFDQEISADLLAHAHAWRIRHPGAYQPTNWMFQPGS